MATEKQVPANLDVSNASESYPDSTPTPSWHLDILQRRQHRIDQGQTRFRDWEELKQSFPSA